MSSPTPDQQALHLEAYKILVGMLQHDDEQFWRRTDILMALNGALLTVVNLTRPAQSAPAATSWKAVSLAICVVGVVVCAFWFLISKRGEAFYNHWYDQLEFLETHYLSPIQVFRTADDFFSKGTVKLGDEKLELDRLSRSIKIFAAIQALSGIIVLVWVGLGAYLLLYA